MRFLINVLVKLILLVAVLLLFTRCAALPEPIVVEKPVALLPPAELVARCPSPPSDGSIGAELARLAQIVRCEWARDDALRAWVEKAR